MVKRAEEFTPENELAAAGARTAEVLTDETSPLTEKFSAWMAPLTIRHPMKTILNVGFFVKILPFNIFLPH